MLSDTDIFCINNIINTIHNGYVKKDMQKNINNYLLKIISLNEQLNCIRKNIDDNDNDNNNNNNNDNNDKIKYKIAKNILSEDEITNLKEIYNEIDGNIKKHIKVAIVHNMKKLIKINEILLYYNKKNIKLKNKILLKKNKILFEENEKLLKELNENKKLLEENNILTKKNKILTKKIQRMKKILKQ